MRCGRRLRRRIGRLGGLPRGGDGRRVLARAPADGACDPGRRRRSPARRCGRRRSRSGSAGGSGSPTAGAPGRAPRRGAQSGITPEPSACGTAAISACVYGCFGRCQSSCVGPDSTITPRYMTETTSATCRTIARSCEISSSPMSSPVASDVSRFAICAWADVSSAESGSSSTITDGSAASARAIAIRCRWPPENSCGKRVAESAGRPTPDGYTLLISAPGPLVVNQSLFQKLQYDPIGTSLRSRSSASRPTSL